MCQKLRDECFDNPIRLEKPIKKCKVKNFAADAVKVKVTVKRDLIGRLLYLAGIIDLDLHLVFTYPLTPAPLSLAHVNSTLYKTDKTKLMHKLEEKVTSGNPLTNDAYVVDAMFFSITGTSTKNVWRTGKKYVEKNCWVLLRGLTLWVIHTQVLLLKM